MHVSLIVVALVFQASAQADTWMVRADSWCPYNCEPGNVNPGYMIEVINQAAAATGNKVEYKTEPWSRALIEARSGVITAVVGMATGDSDGLNRSDKMGTDSTCFFVNEGDLFKYTGPQDMAKLKSVGTAQDYGYPEVFTEWQKSNPGKVQSLAGDNIVAMNVKKLKRNRIQAFLENETVIGYAKKSNPDLEGIVNAGCLNNEDLFIGYSQKSPAAPAMKKAVDTKLAELRKSGGLAKILTKYGVAGW